MKVTITTQLIQEKLSLLNHAISNKGQLPILMHILIEAKDKSVILKSTDLEIGIQTKIPAEVIEEGAIAVPAKQFIELVSTIGGSDITLTGSESALEIRSKQTKSVLQTTSKEEFPRLYSEKGEQAAVLDMDQLRQDLGSVIFAASTDTTRPSLSGILLKKEKDGLLIVATDGYRLSLKHSKSKSLDKGSEESLLVPSRVLREIQSLKDQSQITMYLAKEQNQILFEQTGTELVGRLIEAQFPSYEKIIPTDVASTITFDREEALKAVKMCSIFARDGANIIKFSLRKSSLTISSQAPSLGENTVDVDAVLVGEENEIAFNARYVLDVLSNLAAEQISLEMTGPLNPGVFKIKGDSSYLHLIMPIRVQD